MNSTGTIIQQASPSQKKATRTDAAKIDSLLIESSKKFQRCVIVEILCGIGRTNHQSFKVFSFTEWLGRNSDSTTGRYRFTIGRKKLPFVKL